MSSCPVDGRMAGEAEVRFAPPQPAHIDGMIQQLVVTVEGEQATLEQPAHFVVDGGAMSLEGITLTGTRSNLFVRAARSASGALSGNVSGELPGVLLGLVWREARPSGRVELLGEISGTDAAPRFEGTARVTDGSLRVPGLPEPATRIAGVLEFTPEAVKLDGVTFSILGGTGVCHGSIVLSPQLGLDLALSLNAVRWPLITGLTPILSGEVRLVGTLQDLSLSGKASLKHTVFRRDLDLQKLVLEQIRAPERARVTEGSPMALNLAVDVPGTLEVDTPLAKLVARGDLRIVGTTARYGVLGRLEALPGGELDFAGNRYDLDRASVTFTSPDRIEPHLDILARTTVQTYDVTVGLNGTLDRLTPTFSSNPPLPEMDVISPGLDRPEGRRGRPNRSGGARVLVPHRPAHRRRDQARADAPRRGPDAGGPVRRDAVRQPHRPSHRGQADEPRLDGDRGHQPRGQPGRGDHRASGACGRACTWRPTGSRTDRTRWR